MHDLIKELTDGISREVLTITIYNQSLRDYTGVHLRSEVALLAMKKVIAPEATLHDNIDQEGYNKIWFKVDGIVYFYRCSLF